MFLEGRKINIKTSTKASNTLLLKKSDWDSDGKYIHGNDGPDDSYKVFFLCRMKLNPRDFLTISDIPNIDDKEKKINELNLKTYIDREIANLENVNFSMDIPGFIDIDDFRDLISQNLFIKAGCYLQTMNFKLSEHMYYCQAGDLREMDEIPKKKK